MDIKKLQGIVVNALEDVKAQDIRIFDTSHLTSMFDRIAIASGTSNRQTKALASSVRDSVKAAGGNIISMEGEGTGEWVLVDLGDIVVHVMLPAVRAYYTLEEIWGGKQVRLKRVPAPASASASKAAARPKAKALPKGKAVPRARAVPKARALPRTKARKAGRGDS